MYCVSVCGAQQCQHGGEVGAQVRGHGWQGGCKQQCGPRWAGTASLLFMKQQTGLGHGCQGKQGSLFTVPTGIGSWSQGQGSGVWGKGCVCLWVQRGIRSTGGTLLQTSHTCSACQSTCSGCVCDLLLQAGLTMLTVNQCHHSAIRTQFMQ